jgi:hypothetical protein
LAADSGRKGLSKIGEFEMGSSGCHENGDLSFDWADSFVLLALSSRWFGVFPPVFRPYMSDVERAR